MGAPPPARLLDLTRTVSRLDRGVMTGIDRVELAYLRHFLADALPLFGLVRTPLGFVLLDRAGAQHVLARAMGAARPGPVDMIGRLLRRGKPGLAREEADLRRLALARAPRSLLATVLRRLPPGTECWLVGHADLTKPVLTALRRGTGGRVIVMLHDTIPLDHPDMARSGMPARQDRALAAVASGSDLVICTTADAQALAAPHLRRHGRVPPMRIAALGVDRALADVSALPADVVAALASGRPLFLTIGTIEPRKNHALLLDLWQRMHATLPEAEVPLLVIAGARGWRNEGVFHRLDSLPFLRRTVFECAGLGDGALAALMDRAAALLFPSLAEGFGLPPVEAAARGLPVIAAPLPSLREVLGNGPAYLDVTDADAWAQAIRAAAAADSAASRAARQGVAVPDWASHFNIVLNPA